MSDGPFPCCGGQGIHELGCHMRLGPEAEGTGLDDGPWLPGRAPRRKPPPKSSEELAAIRAKAWETRRARYGQKGHR